MALWLGAIASLVTAGVLIDGWRAFGHRAEGARRARIEQSPQWKDGHFENPQPLVNDGWGMLTGFFKASPDGSPKSPLPVEPIDPLRFRDAPKEGLRVTWLGHSSLLIEIDGYRILTDPVWSERASPLGWMGPKRWYSPPIALKALPSLDAVVISHDHYDHLDYPTITAIKDWNTTFIVPLGVGAHLAYWGVPESRIVELDWWERAKVRELEIVSTPARHASGRFLFDRGATLWSGFAFLGAKHRAYYSGDTGLFPGLKQIGEKLGPFDMTMIESGAYGQAWPDWHLGPEQAVVAHQLVRGKAMIPVHWGLFNLAYHSWTEPAERVLEAGKQQSATVIVPRPGQSIEPEPAPALERWWPDVPWNTAQQYPIVSTQMN